MLHLFKSVTRDSQPPVPNSGLRPSRRPVTHWAAAGLTLAAMLAASACGTPAVGVSVTNPGIALNATTLPTATDLPTLAPAVVTARPAASVSPVSTSAPAIPNSGATGVPASATPLVVGYLLFGTPTQTEGPAGQSVPVTVTPAYRPSDTAQPATVTVVSTSATVISQPSATTVSASGGAAMTVTPNTRVITATVTVAAANAMPTMADMNGPTVAPVVILTNTPVTVASSVPSPAAVAANASPAAAAGGVSPTPDAWTAMNLVGDPVSGKNIFQNVAACSACHNVANPNVLVGPSLMGISQRAATRRPGYSAVQYIHESIVIPNAYIVPGFTPGIMPQTFGQTLTPQQIADVIAYLMTL